jgi:hypothetical protein
VADQDAVLDLRTLDEPIPEPALPPGFTIRAVAGEAEVAARVALQREAFGRTNQTVEGRLAFMRDPAYVPDLDLVAVAPDGTLAAFVVEVSTDSGNTATQALLASVGYHLAHRVFAYSREV